MGLSQGIRAGAAYVELYTKDSRMVKGLQAAEKKLQAFGSAISSIGTNLTALGVAAITPLIASTKVFASMGDTLAKMSARTGVSVESLSELGYAADQSGADLEALEAALRRMQKQVVQAAGGAQASVDAFARLGISVQDLSRLSPEGQFKLIAERLSAIRNPTLKAALAMELFGKSGTKLLPLINDGVRGIEELQQQARDLGLTIATEDAKAAEVFGDRLDDLWKVLKSTAFVIGSSLAPLLQEAAIAMTRIIVRVTQWIRGNKDLVVWVFKIAAAVTVVGAALLVLGTVISGIGAALGAVATVFTGIGAAIATLGSILGAILSPIGLVIAGIVGLAGYILYATGVGQQALTWLASIFDDLKHEALAAFQGISNALAAGDIALAAKVLWLTLAMEWQKGINWLQEKWIGFKEYFLSVWTEAVYGLAKIMTNAWALLQSTWTETVAGMSTAWAVFASGAVSAWRGAQNFISKGIVRLMGMLDSSVDVEGTIAILEGDFQREQKDRQSATKKQLSDIESERQQRQSTIEQERTGALGSLDQEKRLANESRKQEFDAQLQASQDALSKARQEWEQSLAQAADAKKESDSRRTPDRVRRAELELDGLDELIGQTQQKVDVVGSFNPIAAVGLGSDTLAQRTAKSTEDVANNTKRLVQQADRGGVVFS